LRHLLQHFSQRSRLEPRFLELGLIAFDDVQSASLERQVRVAEPYGCEERKMTVPELRNPGPAGGVVRRIEGQPLPLVEISPGVVDRPTA
jgi:hypothetical protein